MLTRLGIAFVAVAALLCGLAATAHSATKKPDLVVRSAYIISDEVVAGQSARLVATVRNAGKGSARKSRLGFWLSRNSELDKRDLRLPSKSVRALRPRQAAHVRASILVPMTTPDAEYRVLACADNARQVTEGREGNNCRVAPGRLTTTGGHPVVPWIPIRPLLPPPAPTTALSAPTSLHFEPSSSDDLTARLLGTAIPGASVQVFRGSRCPGEPVASGSAEGLANPGIPVPALPNQTMLVSARTVLGSTTSRCTRFTASYRHFTRPTPPALSLDQASPGNTAGVVVTVTSASGMTVRLYLTADCSGIVAKSGTTDADGRLVSALSVAQNATTMLSARVRDANGLSSVCSTPVEFVESGAWEAEPNGTSVQAASSWGRFDGSGEVFGRIAPDTSDVDVYPLWFDTMYVLDAAVLDTSGEDTCAGEDDFELALKIDGFLVASDDNTGVDTCAEILALVRANSYDLWVRSSPLGAAGAANSPYRLVVDYLPGAEADQASPPSPAAEGAPVIYGRGTYGSTVTLYSTPDCSGAALASGTAEAFDYEGFVVTVPAGATVTIFAAATLNGESGPCSPDGLTYTNSMPAP